MQCAEPARIPRAANDRLHVENQRQQNRIIDVREFIEGVLEKAPVDSADHPEFSGFDSPYADEIVFSSRPNGSE